MIPRLCGPSQTVRVSTARQRPSSPLSNTTTIVAGSLVSALEVTDIRYELSIYGQFLQDIPRRLGRNAALDSSVVALTTAFGAVHTRTQPAEVFVKYATALSSLRLCLHDPVEAQSPETLCAIWFVVICQVGGRSPEMDDLRMTESLCILGLDWKARRYLC